MGFFGYFYSVRKVMKDENAKANFSSKDIVMSLVDLMNARKRLSSYEYHYVERIFNFIKCLSRKTPMNRAEFIEIRNVFISHFDLVAPYHKYCGNSGLNLDLSKEREKEIYRDRARDIIDECSVFSNEWFDLQKEFYKLFYADGVMR